MNRKQLILVLLALAIVGGAALVLVQQHKESSSETGAKMGDKVLPNFRPNDVAAIHIKGASELDIVHKNDLWRVAERNDYPANFGKISDVLIKLQGLKVVEAENVGTAQLGRVNLDEPGSSATDGTLVEFKDAQGKIVEALLLGKKHFRDQGESSHAVVAGEPDGRYILLRSDPKTVFLISDALAGLEPRADAWVSHDFFKVEGAKSVSLTALDPANSWKISRETESSPWMLADAKSDEKLDAKKVLQITNSLSTPRFAGVAPANDLPTAGLDKPTMVTTETFDHFVYSLKISSKGADDNYHLIVEVTADLPSTRVAGNNESPADRKKLDDEFSERSRKLQTRLKQEQALSAWVYTINSWILDPVTRSRAQILEGYREEPPADSASTAASSGPKKDAPAWTPRVIH